jgi:Kef-type K+ transport system membrane component KefB
MVFAVLAPDPVASLLLGLAILLMAAKIGGHAAVRLGQPAVLGELVAGIVLGHLALVGVPGLAQIKYDPFVDMIARLGVIILLFEVGLESTVGEMLKVGARATAVASLGLTASFVLGWAAAAWLLPGSSVYAHAFVGATLCATSVGIAARVLQDLGRARSPEARLILGAAVIDDVLSLVVLALVSGMVLDAGRGRPMSYTGVLLTLGKAVAFLVGSLVAGVLLSPKLFLAASRIQARGVLTAVGLSFCFFLSWAAGAVGLAPIVGAFAAGLILEDVHYREFVARGGRALGELIRPISDFLVPVFFVLMGMRTDLASFAEPRILGLALALTAAAVLGKQACSLGALGASVNRFAVALGMIPRGEVTLIFANVGLSLSVAGRPILEAATFSAIVVMVLVTTLVTPPALKWSLARRAPSGP